MGWDDPRGWLLVILGAMLLAAGIEDARQRTIGNRLNAAIALMAPLWWWAAGLHLWPDIAIQIAVALVVFGLFVGLFALGWMGGGDVKLVGALALWLPLGALASMLVATALIGGLVSLVMVIDRLIARRTAPVEVPYGVAIAAAALLALREPLLHQFP
jgi:prepilin peptidase CpaA